MPNWWADRLAEAEWSPEQDTDGQAVGCQEWVGFAAHQTAVSILRTNSTH